MATETTGPSLPLGTTRSCVAADTTLLLDPGDREVRRVADDSLRPVPASATKTAASTYGGSSLATSPTALVVVLLDSDGAARVGACTCGQATVSAFAENRLDAVRASGLGVAAPQTWISARCRNVAWLLHAYTGHVGVATPLRGERQSDPECRNGHKAAVCSALLRAVQCARKGGAGLARVEYARRWRSRFRA
jgi:hypothetical protein